MIPEHIHRRARFPIMLVIAGAVVTLDRFTKNWFLEHFQVGESRQVFKFLYFTLVKNTGTAFGLLQGNNRGLLIVSFVILGVLLYGARGLVERGGTWAFWGVALILGGALGNIVDRYLYAQVIDFIDLRVWPVFNVADSAITVGTLSLMIGLIRS